ncbi:carbohydate-binding domain-containing protein [Massilia sp. IC2-477]|uniref:family 20 glycosylhydrolase n=1 Tax=Massilia sp. IC2-477 TaxID=2887198 RepID=UPI001D12CCCA|nr:family 20 glycosylhydrolase [Massilia sp. IC2-477]MCC2958340.1 carbohydate-binding domain-containing protein [Massilia sp. IC2-477]
MIPTTDRTPGGPAIAIAWECLSNYTRDDAFTARLTLRNDSNEAIAPGWAICFNTCRKVIADSVSPGYAIEHLNGDLFRLTMPAADAWEPGVSHTVEYEALHWAISITDAPLGFYLLPGDGGQPIDLGDPEIAPFARPEQRHRMRGDLLPTADAAWRFEQNAVLHLLPESAVGRITPRPQSARFDGRHCLLSRHAPLSYDRTLWNEASLLASMLGVLPGVVPGGSGDICLEIGPVDEVTTNVPLEAYCLEIEPGRVRIRGASPHGVFNGIQSLVQLLGPNGELPAGRVVDAPRFGYRGMMLDVARHFAGVTTVLRLLDCMASYKLNRFHFHLTDDEGWRLAIGALPELTAVGARRGVSLDGSPCLPPSFGSGADPEASAGSGFYTASEFITILRHAHARHIEVIPEFNMPGHARAAVTAMRARHRRLVQAGEHEAAEEYLLSDPDDASSYESVQLWHDNVICIALPSVDRFIDTVVGEVCMLYREAGVPLRVIHTGGDEVPPGAWLGSPRCRALMEERGWSSVQQLHDDFLERCRAILARHGVEFAGWDETALVREGERLLPNPRFAGPDFHVYVWNNAWGSGQEDCAYRLANAGYDVVLSNAANLYFDLAYAKHPQEPGYYWAGFVGTRNAFGFCPLDVGAMADLDPMGRSLAPTTLQPLDVAGRGRIAGLQGQLWGENARSRARLEYLALPRLIGLAERAWAPDPGWQDIPEPDRRAAWALRDWNEFANRLGQRELPRLDRARRPWDYRLPPPGAVLQGRLLQANVALPGLAVHYTLDGLDPTARSPRYVAPVPVDAAQVVKLATFDTRGRASRIVTLNVEPA